MPTITLHPAAVLEDDSSFLSVDSSHPFSNAIGKGADSSVYAQWYMVTGGSAITKVLYAFDTSEIPGNAVITQVTCQAKCQAQNSSSFRGGNTTVSLLSGSSSMTSTDNQVFGTSATVVTVPEVSWTRDQLTDCRINIQAARGLIGTSTSYYIRFYGATLTVTYDVPEEKSNIWIKRNGVFVQGSKAFKKENGAWVIITEKECMGLLAGGNYKSVQI